MLDSTSINDTRSTTAAISWESVGHDAGMSVLGLAAPEIRNILNVDDWIDTLFRWATEPIHTRSDSAQATDRVGNEAT